MKKSSRIFAIMIAIMMMGSAVPAFADSEGLQSVDTADAVEMQDTENAAVTDAETREDSEITVVTDTETADDSEDAVLTDVESGNDSEITDVSVPEEGIEEVSVEDLEALTMGDAEAVTNEAMAAAVSPGSAQTIQFTSVYYGGFTDGSNQKIHYYKFTTKSQKTKYTLMAMATAYNENGFPGLDFELLDRNLNLVLPDGKTSNSLGRWLYLYDGVGDSGSMAYSSLNTGSVYYIRVTNKSVGSCSGNLMYRLGVSAGSQVPDVAGGTAISFGKWYNGEFKKGTRVKHTYYKFTSSAFARKYTLMASNTKYDSNGSSPLDIQLLDRNLNLVLPDGKTSNSLGRWIYLYGVGQSDSRTYSSLNAAQVYYIRVSNYDSYSGTNGFAIKVDCQTKDSQQTTQTQQTGPSTGSGEIRYFDKVYFIVRDGSTYSVRHSGQTGAVTVNLHKAANKKTITIPASITDNSGTVRTVNGISPYAFSGSKAKTVNIKTTALTRESVYNSLNGSRVKTIKVKVPGGKKVRKAFVKQYKKFFKKSNCGKKVKVK